MADKKNSSIAGRILPNASDAEQELLSCAMQDEDAYLYMTENLMSSYFYVEAHRKIFEAMAAIRGEGARVDLITLTNKFTDLSEVGGMQTLAAISTKVPMVSLENVKAYVKIIREKYMLRGLIQACSRAVNGAFTNADSTALLTSVGKEIYDIGEEMEHGKLLPVRDVTSDVMNKLHDLSVNGVQRGLSTGFAGLNSALNGFQPSDLILIAARPSVGKTALAMNFVTNVAIGQKGDTGPKKVCAVFSLEMAKEQLTQRMLASVAGVSLEKINKGNLSTEDWENLRKARIVLNETELYIDDTSMITATQMLDKCTRLKSRLGRLDLVMIDYLQLMMSDRQSESRQNEVSEITRFLKIMAKELNVPVLLLSQLSRKVESRQDKTPILSDLRESGAIEQDADIVMFIHREKDIDHPSEEADLIIAKHRNGALTRVPLLWKGEFTRFKDDPSRGQGKFDATHEPPVGQKKFTVAEPTSSPMPSQIGAYYTEGDPFAPPPPQDDSSAADGADQSDNGDSTEIDDVF